MNIKEVSLVLAEALQSAGAGVVGETIFIGRIPIDKQASGFVSVSAQGGNAEGGNIAKYRTRYQFTVNALQKEASSLYEIDEKINTALVAIPYNDARFIEVSVASMNDLEQIEAEYRVGAWNIEAVVFNDSFESGE